MIYNLQNQLNETYAQLKNPIGLEPSIINALVGPETIKIKQSYLESSPRIMIVGQENYGWYTYHDFIGFKQAEDSTEVYDNFNFGKEYYSSPFWRYFHKIRCDLHGKDVWDSVVWTNLIKFSLEENNKVTSVLGKVNEKEILNNLRGLLAKEINILKPEVVIFFTGPKFDRIIKFFFNEIELSELNGRSSRSLALITDPIKRLPEFTYRVYHPGYGNRYPQLRETYDLVVKDIKQKLN